MREQVGHSLSAENASQLGKMACDDYSRAVKDRLQRGGRSVPKCSVMLGTDKYLFIVLDFDKAEDAMLTDSTFDLLRTFGASLDSTGYDGEVILRSDWFKWGDAKSERWYQSFPMRWVEFAYEEAASGMRQDLDAWWLFNKRFRNGQTKQDALAGSNKFLVRDAIVVKTTPVGNGRTFLYTTDGAKWDLPESEVISCRVVPGSGLSEFVNGGESQFTIVNGVDGCIVHANFLAAW